MTEGVGVVELKKMKLNLPEGGLKLAYGGVLKEIEVAYEECGAPLGESNAIYICHALTGDAHVAGIRPGEEKPSGWWEEMVRIPPPTSTGTPASRMILQNTSELSSLPKAASRSTRWR